MPCLVNNQPGLERPGFYRPEKGRQENDMKIGDVINIERKDLSASTGYGVRLVKLAVCRASLIKPQKIAD
jgi:hypothetical protein